jgi:Tfp pilus assembly protein PilN
MATKKAKSSKPQREPKSKPAQREPQVKPPSLKKLGFENGSSARANFLPPSVLVQRESQRVRRQLFSLSVTTIVIAALAFIGSSTISFSGTLLESDAELRLSQVKAAQAEYLEIVELERQIRFFEAARLVAAARDIDYQRFLTSLEGILPEGAVLLSVEINPSASPVTSVDGSVTYSIDVLLSLRARDFASLQQFSGRLGASDGFVTSSLQSIKSDEQGVTANLTAVFGPQLLTGKFREPLVLGEPVPQASGISRTDSTLTAPVGGEL